MLSTMMNPNRTYENILSLPTNSSIYDFILSPNLDQYRDSSMWYSLLHFHLFNLSYKKEITVEQFLENFKIFLLQENFNETPEQATSPYIFNSTFAGYFTKLYEIISLEIFDTANESICKNFLYIFCFIYQMERNPFEENIRIVKMMQYLYNIFEDLSMKKERARFRNIYNLIISIIKKTMRKFNYPLKNENEEKFTLFEQTNYDCSDNASTSNNHISKNPTRDNSTFKEEEDDKSSLYLELYEKAPKDEDMDEQRDDSPVPAYINQTHNLHPPMEYLAKKLYDYNRKKLVTTSNMFHCNKVYVLISIGSTSIGVTNTGFYRDLVILPRNTNMQSISLNELSSWMSWKMGKYEMQPTKNTYDRKESGVLTYKCINTITKEVAFNATIHLWNGRYLLCNNLIKSIFRKHTNLCILHIFYQKILMCFGIVKRIDVTFLLIAFVDYVYNVFNTEQKIVRNVKNARFNPKGEVYNFSTEEVYYYNYDKTKMCTVQRKTNIKELIVNFINFIMELTLYSTGAQKMSSFPEHLFDEKYVFNINRPLGLLLEKNGYYSNFVLQMEMLKEKMQSDSVAYYVELLKVIHLTVNNN